VKRFRHRSRSSPAIECPLAFSGYYTNTQETDDRPLRRLSQKFGAVKIGTIGAVGRIRRIDIRRMIGERVRRSIGPISVGAERESAGTTGMIGTIGAIGQIGVRSEIGSIAMKD